MKLLASVTILSLIGSYVSVRNPNRARNLKWVDSFGTGDYESNGRLAQANKVESVFDNDLAVDEIMGFSKQEEEELVPAERDSIYAEIMKEVEAKLETATAQAVDHLRSVLMLDEASETAEGLLEKIADFRRKLMVDLEDDLFDLVESFKRSRSADGPLSDDERYEFMELLKSKWEATLAKDLEEFQKTILPRWVSSVRDVWKGLEKKVMAKIEKFKQYVHKTSPRSSDTCALPSPILLGTNAISAATKSLNPVELSRGSALTTVGRIALFILAVSGIICLALASPFFFYLLGVFWLIDWITAKIFYR